MMNARSRAREATGSAVVIVVSTLLVLSAMGLALVLLSITETMAARNTTRASAVLYAAQAGVERSLSDLAHLSEWDEVLDGRTVSGFSDGPPAGLRVLPGGRRISLDEIVNLANCGEKSGCTAAQMEAITADRPWGRNNPRWRVFAHGPLAALAPAGVPEPTEYVVVLVADDPAESDDDPMRDGRAGNPGAGSILLRSEAFGAQAAHSVVEATVFRGVPQDRAAGYEAQRGQGRTSGAAAGGVQVPGRAVTRMEMPLTGGMTRQ